MFESLVFLSSHPWDTTLVYVPTRNSPLPKFASYVAPCRWLFLLVFLRDAGDGDGGQVVPYSGSALAPWWRRDYLRWRFSYSLLLFAHNRWERR